MRLYSIVALFSLTMVISHTIRAEESIRVLSLDGRGIRGILEVVALT